MLTPGIHDAFNDGVERLARHRRRDAAGRGQTAPPPCAGQAALFETDAANFLANPALEDEIFGAASLMVSCSDIGQFRAHRRAPRRPADRHHVPHRGRPRRRAALLPVLERKAGRILVNGFPTGVEVSHAMVHGGPFPATSDSRSTSVGAGAIDRFLRPVSYQDLPAFLLPAALQDNNPLGLWRVRDGELAQA